MKFKKSIIINAPVEKVVVLFMDSESLHFWQDDLVRKNHISGTVGKDGAISKLYYKNNKYDMELTETIISNKLPGSLEAKYHHKHMDNNSVYVFTPINDLQTKYTIHVTYTRIDWIMPKLISIFFPSMYKKPGERWMKNFKEFVEKS